MRAGIGGSGQAKRQFRIRRVEARRPTDSDPAMAINQPASSSNLLPFALPLSANRANMAITVVLEIERVE